MLEVKDKKYANSSISEMFRNELCPIILKDEDSHIGLLKNKKVTKNGYTKFRYRETTSKTV